MSKPFVWFITGTSTGIGRDLTRAALKRGDKVVATARNVSKIQDLSQEGASTLQLDVTAPVEKLRDVAKQAVGIYGRIDVVVNNAGYIEVGAVEENTHEETHAQFNTNVFGALNVSRVFLPYLREQKSGTVVWTGSLVGWDGQANMSLYSSTKFAIRGLSESLHAEISQFGLQSIYFEPGYFRTSFLSNDHRSDYESRIPAYTEIGRQADAALKAYNGKQPGDPKKLVEVVLDVVHGDGVAKGREIPLGLPLGTDALDLVRETLTRTDKVLTEWEDVIRSTDFPKGT